MDLPAFDYGWAAALTALVVLTGAVLNRVWKKDDAREDTLEAAEAAYREAIAARDPRRIRIAAKRLRHARAQANATNPGGD